MALNSKSPALVNPKRFKPIQDLHQWSPDCEVSVDDSFTLDREPLLITDPKYLWETFNPSDDPSSSYVRTHGVIVSDFGGEASCPVWWCDPFLLLPLSSHLESKFSLPEGVMELAGQDLSTSGAFIFLPLRDETPPSLHEQCHKVLTESKGVKVKLPAGRYRVFYEQFEVPEGSQDRLYRNIVAQRQ